MIYRTENGGINDDLFEPKLHYLSFKNRISLCISKEFRGVGYTSEWNGKRILSSAGHFNVPSAYTPVAGGVPPEPIVSGEW